MSCKLLRPDSKEVQEFTRCGREFCGWYDRVPSGEDMSWVRGMHLALVDLYRAGFVLNLGVIEDCGDEPELPAELIEDVGSAQSRIGVPFGIRNYYAEAIDPEVLADVKNLGCGSIADDLYDIQRDIRTGLNRWDIACERERMHWIWYWRLMFKSHWSRHAVGAMRAMLEFIAEKDEDFGA